MQYTVYLYMCRQLSVSEGGLVPEKAACPTARGNFDTTPNDAEYCAVVRSVPCDTRALMPAADRMDAND